MHKYNDKILNDYCQHVRKYVLLAGRNTPKEIEEAKKYMLSNEEAYERYGFLYGQDLYDFQIEHPSQEILEAFKQEQPFDVDYMLSLEERLLVDISTSTCVLTVMNDGKLLICRDRRKIIYGPYQSPEELEYTLECAEKQSVIDWENAKIFYHPMHNVMYVSDCIEFGILSNNIDDDLLMPSIPFSKEITSDDLLSLGDEALINILNSGCKPKFFNAGFTLLNRLEVDKIYEFKDIVYNSRDSYYLEILKHSDLLDIEENCDSFFVKNVYNSRHKKPKSKKNTAAVTIINNCTLPKKSHCIPKDFVGIDFETLYAQRVSACSVGMVKYKNGELVDRYYSLIKPPFDYPGKTGNALTWIHGFTEDMLENERTFAEILPEMEAFAEGLPLVAHNAYVEKACIRDTSLFYGTTTVLDYDSIIDTYPLSKEIEHLLGVYVEGQGTHTLDAVCRRFHIPELHHHNALDDAEMCGNLLLEFDKILQENNKVPIDISASSKPIKEKYKAEDKVQRTDLENVVDNPFKDCGVVLTGFSTAISQEYGHQLKELGAKVCTSVSKKTKWLICGSNAGPSKLAKAQELGIYIINEEEFLQKIQAINE